MANSETRAIHAAGHEAGQSMRHDATTEARSDEGGMPQLNPESYAGQLFWLAVTFIALYLLISKSALPRIEKTLAERQRRIDDDINRAEQMTEQADAARAGYEKLHNDTKKNVAHLLEDAKAEAERLAKAKFAELDHTLSATFAEAQTRLKAETAAISKEIEPLAAQVTGQIVEKLRGHAPASKA